MRLQPDAASHAGGSRLTRLLDAAAGPAPALAAGGVAALLLTALQSPMLAVMMALGFAGAFVAGLVGVGGAIVMIPLLLYVPPALGLGPLVMHQVAGITMVQVAAAGLTGMLAHRRSGAVDASLVIFLGGAMLVASVAGGVVSSRVPASTLNTIFAALAAAGALLMLGGRRGASSVPDAGPPRYNRALAVIVGIALGLLVGMVGAGGGFMLVPVMIYLLGVPVRVAVGTSLAIVAMSGVGGTFGKAVTGQVDWLLALALVAGALPGAQLGSMASRQVPAAALARMLGILIALVAIKMWWDVLR